MNEKDLTYTIIYALILYDFIKWIASILITIIGLAFKRPKKEYVIPTRKKSAFAEKLEKRMQEINNQKNK